MLRCRGKPPHEIVETKPGTRRSGEVFEEARLSFDQDEGVPDSPIVTRFSLVDEVHGRAVAEHRVEVVSERMKETPWKLGTPAVTLGAASARYRLPVGEAALMVLTVAPRFEGAVGAQPDKGGTCANHTP